MTRFFAGLAAAFVVALPALAQDGATLDTAQSDTYGTYLTDGDGRALYLFTADTRGGDGQEPVIACDTACLAAWPLFTTDAEPRAAEPAQADLIGTTQHDGETVVTYDGWPLYHFVQDQGAAAPQGQDIESFGGEWYLVTPEGGKVGHE